MPLITPNTSPSLRETLEETLGPELVGALEKKGFERLTPVQQAVLAEDLYGKDLRISSQTGSGKTVAIGLTIREHVASSFEDEASDSSASDRDREKRARPRALVVTPTRELARQVQEELAWLYAPLGAGVVSVTGGGGYRDELRAFRAGPAIVVGTPGRLLDHLNRGAIDASKVGVIVLDEADQMLDLGFRDDLEAILGHTPADRRTHLVSATFPAEVRALADRVQRDPVAVEGTPLGSANLDIEHLIHLVKPRDRLGAIINLLLENPSAQSLVFARTRADVADIANALTDAGFDIAMLSGEMEQAERNRALTAFKRGSVTALVATDVAARGIDVQDVARVIHAEPPNDPDAYTHRSGRTGRAGRKGISSLIATERELPRTVGLLGRARVQWRFGPIPSASSIRDARDETLLATLTAELGEEETLEPRFLTLATRILESPEHTLAVGRLVALALRRSQAEPRDVAHVEPPPQATRSAGAGRRADAPRSPREWNREEGWTPFRISWGASHGADTRRLVAMMCRRGKIEGRHIGTIRVGRTSSVVEVSAAVATEFERATSRPDPRDPRVHIRRFYDEPTGRRTAHDERPRAPAPRSRAHREEDATPHEVFADAAIDATRSSHHAARDRSAPKDRPSVPKDRPSARKEPSIPKDRPSVRKEPSVPKDRPSVPKDRPSVPKDKPSVPKDRPSVRKDPAVPKDRPSVPKDKPSVPRDKSSVPKDRPSVSKDKTSVSKDSPSRAARPSPVIRRGRPTARDEHAPAKDRPAPSGKKPSRHDKKPPFQERGKPWSPKPSSSSSSKKRGGPPWQGGGGHAPPKRRGRPR